MDVRIAVIDRQFARRTCRFGMLRRNMVTFEIRQNLADADKNGTPDRQLSGVSLGAF
jgi:hypothetical protein